jgi:hypothetical protein
MDLNIPLRINIEFYHSKKKSRKDQTFWNFGQLENK